MKKKIIFYTDCYTFGGCEKVIYEIMSSGSFKQKYDYYLVYRSSQEYKKGLVPFYAEINFKNIKEVRFWDLNTWYFCIEQAVPSIFLSSIIKKFSSLLFHILMPLLFIYEYVYLYFIFSNLEADIVHINNGGYPGALSCCAAAVAAKSAGKKHIILGVHNLALKESNIFNKIIDFLVRKSVSTVITVSQASAFTLNVNRNFDKKIIRTIYLGVKAQPISNNSLKNSNSRCICMIGRFEERKGHRYAILALRRLISSYLEYTDLKLIFLGTGPLLKKMQRFVFRQGLEKNIDFLGYRSECINYIANSSFLLNPSLELESLPYSILEAMSVGVPAIGTNVGGIPEEIEDGVTGIIVAAGDTEKLVQAMLTLIKDSRKRQEMGEASRRRFADSFTLDKMLDNYLQLYAGLN